ncbi:TolC family outer membrane protein [Magnetovibrio sp.]|uniref:TolC family outer membrane protein n=1 Tax=Magnetovibrio sp. TaxID=2024836 RepID=UPI002F952473
MVFSVSAAQADSLQEALGATYQSNPTLLAAREALRVTIEQYPQAQANWMPRLSTSATAADTLSRSKTDTRSQSRTSELKNTLSLSQPIYRGGRNFAELRKAEAAVNAQRATYTTAEQTVILAAITAYMDVIRDRRIRDLRKANVDLLQQRLESTQTQYDLRRRTLTDLSQAQARLSQAKATFVQSESTLASSTEQYVQVIGRPPAELSMPDTMASMTDSLDTVLAQIDDLNPAVLAAEYALEQSREDVKIQTGARLPTLQFDASMSHSRSKELGGAIATRTRDLSGTVTLSVPLYQSGSELSQVRAARYQTNQRLLELDAAKRTARQTAISDWSNLQSTKASLESFEQNAEAARVARDSIVQELDVGRRSLIDLLNADLELLNAEISLASSRRDLVVQAYTVLRSTGQLTARGLDLPIDLYNPQIDVDDAKWNLFTSGINQDSTR